MSSLRFLASRRWVLLALVVLGLSYLAWLLGQWQFSRLDDRRDHSALVQRNVGGPAVPVEEVLAPGRPVGDRDEWRLVSATGTYAVDDTVIVRYRTRDGVAGVDVVVPLVTADGTALLVDRGWLRTDNQGRSDVDVPAPPPGEVTVEGYVRRDAMGPSTAVDDESTRAISSEALGPALGRTFYGGFVELHREDPAPAEPLTPAEPPDVGEGPHFFYGLQWWFFGVLAVGGFAYLAYDEWRGGRSPRAASLRTRLGSIGSERAEHPPVDGEHHAGHERRGG